jgi:antitoxin PrlF
MRVTMKGQVTIPRNVREDLGISPQTEIEFVEDGGRYYIEKTVVPNTKKNLKKLRGVATVKMTTDEIMSLTREQ